MIFGWTEWSCNKALIELPWATFSGRRPRTFLISFEYVHARTHARTEFPVDTWLGRQLTLEYLYCFIWYRFKLSPLDKAEPNALVTCTFVTECLLFQTCAVSIVRRRIHGGFGGVKYQRLLRWFVQRWITKHKSWILYFSSVFCFFYCSD